MYKFTPVRHDTLRIRNHQPSRRWVEENIRPGSVIAVASRTYAPRLKPTQYQIAQKYSYLSHGPESDAKRKRLDLMGAAIEGETTYQIYTLSPGKELEEEAFLFQCPFVESSPEALEEIGAEYLVFNASERIEFFEMLKKNLGDRIRLVQRFNPYWDTERKESLDSHDQTVGPHLLQELFSRKQLGPYMEIYEIS